ncbi:thioredoxin family protein [bacterium]|nr:thioredoxin family protein [bacterium]
MKSIIKSLCTIILISSQFGITGCSSVPKTVSHAKTVKGEMMLIGNITREELFQEMPVFQKNYDVYNPAGSAIETLHRMSTPTDILIVLGTWCGDSKHHVPSFLKTLDAAKNPNLTYRLLAVDRTKKDSLGVTAQYNIKRVPTMIVLQNGAEIGRMVEFPQKTVEEDLLDIVKP